MSQIRRWVKDQDLSEGDILKLADQHIRMFQRRIAIGESKHGNPGVRVDECKMYLRIWEGIRENPDVDTMSEEGVGELCDAISENM